MRLKFSKHIFIWIFIAVALILIDQISKNIILTKFYPNESVKVAGEFFRISYVQNRGIAFGLFNNRSEGGKDVFLFVTPAAICILFYIFSSSPVKTLLFKISFLFIVSGAFGNYIDRLLYGFVVDFLDFEFWDIIIQPFSIWKIKFAGYEMFRWPSFNIADSLISCGVVLLLIHTVFFEKDIERKEEVTVEQGN